MQKNNLTDKVLKATLKKVIRKSDNHRFDMYRFNLYFKHYAKYLKYVQKHESNSYIREIKLMGKKTIINLN